MTKPSHSRTSSSRSGQAMLIAVLTLGGAILGATTLAGLLMLYTIRSTTDSANSAKAIFAADAGVNWALYSYFNTAGGPLPALPGTPIAGSATSSMLSNGATLSVVCSDEDGNTIPCNQDSSSTSAVTEGIADGSRRAFFVGLTGATGTLP